MTAEELMYQVERLTIHDPDDQARLSFYTIQAQAVTAVQLTRIADALATIEDLLRIGIPVETVSPK